jgi:hypothetical protein
VTIHRPTIPVVLHSVQIAPLSVALVLMAITNSLAKGTDDTAVKQVRASWQQRERSIKCFRYDCTLECSLRKGSRNTIADRPDTDSHEDVPKRDVVLKGTLAFSVSGNKIAYSEEGEQWNDMSNTSRIIRVRAGFDSVDDRRLVEGGRMPLGSLVHGGKPGDTLTVQANETALWLWFSPETQLRRLAYSPEKMTVSQLHAYRDGRDCVEVSIPCNSPSWRILVYADTSRGYLPLQFVQQDKDVVRRDVSIQYVRDEAAGWRVSAWNDKWFSRSGVMEKSSRCTVTQCTINKPLDDGVFVIEFPVGTNVDEHDGDTTKCFIARADGQREYISQREYGRLPGESLPGTGGTTTRIVMVGVLSVTIVALLALLIRRRHRRT